MGVLDRGAVNDTVKIKSDDNPFSFYIQYDQ